MVECSPATRAARVRFLDDARLFVNPKSIQNTWQSPKKQVLYYEYFCFLKLLPSCRQFSKKPFNSITFFRVDGSKKFFCKKVLGGAGYRSRYLSHAKRALYHLSYAPLDDVHSSFLITVLAYMGITLIYEKKLIVKIHSHVNVFSHGLKLLVKSCSHGKKLFVKSCSHGTKLIVKFCVHVTRYIITKSSCRDEMNFNWSQIVNFYGINRGKTHSLSQSIPVVRGWDIVSFTNGKESYRLKIDEWGLDNVIVSHDHIYTKKIDDLNVHFVPVTKYHYLGFNLRLTNTYSPCEQDFTKCNQFCTMWKNNNMWTYFHNEFFPIYQSNSVKCYSYEAVIAQLGER